MNNLHCAESIGRQILPVSNLDKFEERRLVPGFRFELIARGFSMRPEILPGDLLYIEVVQPESISVGDVVVFRKRGHLIAHRVVKKELARGQFIEKGDDKFRPYPVELGSVIGRVTAVKRGEQIKHLDSITNRGASRATAYISYYKFKIIIKLSSIKRMIFGGSARDKSGI